jgi:hypothetical protein
VKAKLAGYVEQPERVLARYQDTDQSVPARYARAYAWHRIAYPDKALAGGREPAARGAERSPISWS